MRRNKLGEPRWQEPLEWISIGFFIGIATMLLISKCCTKEVRLDRYEDGIATVELYNEASGSTEMMDIINSEPMKVIVLR